jgi:hypothetical protein
LLLLFLLYTFLLQLFPFSSHHSFPSSSYCSYFLLFIHQRYLQTLFNNYKDLFHRQRNDLPIVPPSSFSPRLLTHKMHFESWIV